MRWLRRALSWLISLPFFLLVIGFAVSNRDPTIITLWPFGYVMPLPIYALALVPLAFGLLCGAILQGLVGLRHRLAAQRLGQELARLKHENAELQDKLAARDAAPANLNPSVPAPRVNLFGSLRRSTP